MKEKDYFVIGTILATILILVTLSVGIINSDIKAKYGIMFLSNILVVFFIALIINSYYLYKVHKKVFPEEKRKNKKNLNKNKNS